MIEKVKPTHVDRKAILYVRQSSTHQVFHHLESQRLQYAMKEQLETLGWHATPLTKYGSIVAPETLDSGFFVSAQPAQMRRPRGGLPLLVRPVAGSL